MNVGVRLGVFATVVLTAFGAAFAAGAATDPIAPAAGAADHGGAHGGEEPRGATGAAESPVAALLPGLAVSESGYTLRPSDVTLPSGGQVEFAFTVEGPDGAPVQAYRPTHEKEMHLIVVRRDLALFQHLHPNRDATGRWTVPVNLAAAGTYRMFADFAPAALVDKTLTLGADTFVPGVYEPVELPAPQATSSVDGYEVTLGGSPRPGVESELTFTVSRAGTPVADLEPYLAAFGHLVSLRPGDLAYLHTHPAAEAAAGQAGGPEVRFATTFPTAGAYRLFLNFAHGGQVHTASFTVDVPAAVAGPPAVAVPGPGAATGQAQTAPPVVPSAVPVPASGFAPGGHSGH